MGEFKPIGEQEYARHCGHLGKGPWPGTVTDDCTNVAAFARKVPDGELWGRDGYEYACPAHVAVMEDIIGHRKRGCVCPDCRPDRYPDGYTREAGQ